MSLNTNSKLIDYSKLSKDDVKLNDKLIFSYHKKYKIKYLIITMVVGLIALYLIGYFRLGDKFTLQSSIEILPTFVGLLFCLFFMIDMIKWGLERFGIFKPREIKICNYAYEYLTDGYEKGLITKDEFDRMMLVYKI